MNQRAGQYMKALAACGTVTRAAEQLYITPSALSKYISGLEAEVGTPLFSRVGKQFVLTYAGERYLDWCSRIDVLQAQMDSEMYDITNQREGKLRIGSQASLSDFMVDQVVPRFLQQYPNVSVSLAEGNSLDILDQMWKFQMDAAVTTNPPDNEKFLQEALFTIHNVLLVPKQHPLAAWAIQKEGYPYPWIDLDWCRGQRFIMMHPGQGPRINVEKVLASIWGDIRIVMEVRTMRTMIRAVENNIGIIITSDAMERIYARPWSNLTCLSFDTDLPPMQFWLYYHKDVYRSVALNAFLDILREQFAALEAGRPEESADT